MTTHDIDVDAVKKAAFEKKQQIATLENDVKRLTTELVQLDKNIAAVKAAIQTKINSKQAEVFDKQQQIDDLKLEVKQGQAAAKELNADADFDAIDKVVEDLNIRYVISDDEFVFYKDRSTDARKCDITFEKFKPRTIVRFLNKATKRILSVDQFAVTDHFQKKDWDYVSIASTLNESTYNSSNYYNPINEIRKFWLQPNLQDTNYDKNIDDLWLYCLGGGKQENMDHMVKLILFKYMFPEKVANTPNFDINSNPGGVGKGALINVLRTIFTDLCVTQATLSEAERFNANWANKLWVLFDDSGEGDLDYDKMKNITGDNKIMIEPKGVDAYQTERMFTVGILHQGPGARVKLTGGRVGSEDRRWSIMSSNTPMIDRAVELLGLKDNAALTQDDKEEQASKLVGELYTKLCDRTEMAKWLGAKLVKFEDELCKGVLMPLHGNDYHQIKQIGRSPFDDAMAELIGIARNSNGISLQLAHALMKTLTDKVGTLTQFSPIFATALNNAKINYQKLDTVRVEEVFGLDANTVKKQTTYFAFVEEGKRVDQYDLYLEHSPKASKVAVQTGLAKDESWISSVKSGATLVDALENHRMR
jgi:hypothetical protein